MLRDPVQRAYSHFRSVSCRTYISCYPIAHSNRFRGADFFHIPGQRSGQQSKRDHYKIDYENEIRNIKANGFNLDDMNRKRREERAPKMTFNEYMSQLIPLIEAKESNHSDVFGTWEGYRSTLYNNDREDTIRLGLYDEQVWAWQIGTHMCIKDLFHQ